MVGLFNRRLRLPKARRGPFQIRSAAFLCASCLDPIFDMLLRNRAVANLLNFLEGSDLKSRGKAKRREPFGLGAFFVVGSAKSSEQTGGTYLGIKLTTFLNVN